MKLPLICPKRECCCVKKECTPGKGLFKIVLVGSPNAGKSSLFNALSGNYTVVSNYPGTSVEVSRRKGRIWDREYEIIDTPGMYSLLVVSEEERVSQRPLFNEKTFVYLHMLDARNLRRMLSFTFQLLEARLPLILVFIIFPFAILTSFIINTLLRVLGVSLWNAHFAEMNLKKRMPRNVQVAENCTTVTNSAVRTANMKLRKKQR